QFAQFLDASLKNKLLAIMNSDLPFFLNQMVTAVSRCFLHNVPFNAREYVNIMLTSAKITRHTKYAKFGLETAVCAILCPIGRKTKVLPKWLEGAFASRLAKVRGPV